MIQLCQEMNHFLVGQHVVLELLESLGDLNIVHIKSLILLVIIFLLLQRLHQLILLAKKHLLSGFLDKLSVNFLGQHKDVVKRSNRQFCDFELELLDSVFKFLISVTNFGQTCQAQDLDNRFSSESQNNL